jgi:hypothetical protein
MKTAWRYARTRRLLGQLCSEIWVSTPELANRYARFSPRLLEPNYVESKSACGKKSVYFYHGTWAHRREIEWLVPVVRQVQEAIPGAWFEIMGTDRVRRLYRGISRVRVVPHALGGLSGVFRNRQIIGGACALLRYGIQPGTVSQ